MAVCCGQCSGHKVMWMSDLLVTAAFNLYHNYELDNVLYWTDVSVNL